MVLGITGNIASGKSTVARAFADLGAAVVDADQLAREVVAPGSPVLHQLVDCFGTEILQANGQLNREVLGQIIFADSRARAQLNAITHPAIGQLAIERLQALRQQAEIPLIVYEAPLLFEAGAEGRVDRILVVKIDPEEQLRRLLQREQISVDAARQKIAAQMPQDEKLTRADYVIDNSGTISAAQMQVKQLWQRLVASRTD